MHHLKRFLCDAAVYVLSLVVMLVDLCTDTYGLLDIGCSEKLHSYSSGFHTACGIDTRTYLEHYVIDGYVSRLQTGKLDHSKKSFARIAVQLLQTEVCKHTVLVSYGHQVGSYADHQKVKQRNEAFERYVISLGICLDKLESHSAAGKVIERIVAVLPLRIKYSHSSRKLIFRKMMIADDHIYAFISCILDLFICLDAAVEGYD